MVSGCFSTSAASRFVVAEGILGFVHYRKILQNFMLPVAEEMTQKGGGFSKTMLQHTLLIILKRSCQTLI